MQDTEGTRAASRGLSVVIPAYNAGPYLDRCLQSLLDQTLDRSRFDVIAIDDGSTDGTGRRLDTFAARHPELFRVEHIPNSGWPGRPRNLGTELSTQDYVFYCDADDWLLPGALSAILDRAVADDADIVTARPVGNRRAVPLALYEGGDRCTTWRETPGVFSNLTCQKLYRREFLRAQGIRFAEGRVRLEDFLFVTKALLRAERISIYGSQPCYVFERRDDEGNLTATRATEADYFASVEAIIDLVLAETEPGPQQDIALDRVVRSELIGPLSRPPLLRKEPRVQAEALAHGQRLLRTKVPASAVARQDVIIRNRARLIERGDLDDVVRQISAEQAVSAQVTVCGVAWSGSVLVVDLRLELVRDGHVVELDREGDRLFLPRVSPSDERIDVTHTFTRTSTQVHLRSRDRSEEWRVGVALTVVPEASPSRRPMAWTATVRLDAHHVAGGERLRFGVWDLIVVLGSCGYRRDARPVHAPGAQPVEPPPSVQDGVRVRPYWTKASALAVSVRAEGPVRSSRPWERLRMPTVAEARRGWRWARRHARRLGRKLYTELISSHSR